MTKYFIYCTAFSLLSTISVHGQETVNRKFLFKTEYDTTRYLLGSHIELKEVLPMNGELYKTDIDDRDKIYRARYTRSDYIEILHEYLTFQGDSAKSNRCFRFKPGYYNILPEDTVGYTIQVEALYSFTRLLTIGNSPIRPTIVNRKTGQHLNTNLYALREVYDIYRNWYDQNKKSDFKSISFPLNGTSYAWLGEDKMDDRYFRSDLLEYLYKK